MTLTSPSGRSSFARAENRYPGVSEQKEGDEMDGEDCSALLVLPMNESRISKKTQGILSRKCEKEGEQTVQIAVDSTGLLEASGHNCQEAQRGQTEPIQHQLPVHGD